ncbi:MAG: hypothetical protein H8M99_03155, partial [Gloeobacteraceae cyanobacterium ES-bin-144]|nr:hypothetical protein [Verrucomicrobiales bacterium]
MKKPRKYKRWLTFALFSGGLIWFNGPGIRWLAPKIASHYLEKSGFHGSFALEGNLSSGLTLRDIHLKSDSSLAVLSLQSLTPVYHWKDILTGRLNGIEIDGLHADLRLGLNEKTAAKGDEPSLDLDALVRSIRSAREKFIPISIDLKNIIVTATRGEQQVIALAPSSIQHSAGSSELHLSLGKITDANARDWPAQESTIKWNHDDLTLDRLDPLPGLSIRDLSLQLPAHEGPSATMEVRLDDAVFAVKSTPGFTDLSVTLREGRLMADQITERFAVKLPVHAELSSFSLNVAKLFPNP